jgi:hypothetical protein
MLGFEWHEYVEALTQKSAETLIGTIFKDGADLSDWGDIQFADDDAILAKCKDYMAFAWEKANSCRGISAGRSLMHYKAWLWMFGRDDFEDIDDYDCYGKDELVRICEFLDIDHTKLDDGQRSNTEY